MNVLEALLQYLARQQQPGLTNAQAWQEDPNMPAPPRAALPPGLPDAVVRSIMGRPSYGEGETRPLTEQQQMAQPFGPQRTDMLAQQLAALARMRQQNNPYPERGFSPAAPSEYASPLNSMMPLY